VPQADEISSTEIAELIEAALARADAAGVSGKAVTPFPLSRILALTGGRSLVTNIALVTDNAALAARLAVALQVTSTGKPLDHAAA
jgi:pseudouridylate synthase